MNMKEHILAALREQFERWEAVLASLNEEQLTTPNFDLDWSIKDVMAHLWAWQQISIARMQSGVTDREPEYPDWILNLGESWEENADRVNALTFERNHETPWLAIYEHWKNGFVRFLELGEAISERDLLDGDRYPWLNGHNLASILVASYDHHQEHFEKLRSWLWARPTGRGSKTDP
jgi:hypothetical protein